MSHTAVFEAKPPLVPPVLPVHTGPEVEVGWFWWIIHGVWSGLWFVITYVGSLLHPVRVSQFLDYLALDTWRRRIVLVFTTLLMLYLMLLYWRAVRWRCSRAK